MKLAKRIGMKKAKVAIARKIAVVCQDVLHRTRQPLGERLLRILQRQAAR